MSLFDLNPAGDQNVLDQARLNPINPDDLKPGWFAGLWKAPVTGLASAWNDTALLLGDAATPVARTVARPVDSLFGTDLDSWLTEQQQVARRNITDWAPDPRTTGIVGQAVHGLFNIAPEFMAGGPETAAALQGYKGMVKGQQDGLDPGTALGVGAIDALSTWVGLKLPMQVLPKWGAAGAAATGAGGNVATGMITRGATGEWLRANGYKDMAEQYQVLDRSAMALDLLLGGSLGALAHYGPSGLAKFREWREREAGKIQPSDIDTALTLNNQLHAELDTAPGIPANPAARAAHTEAVNDALVAFMRDDPVIARPDVVDAEFVENPQAARVREEVAMAVEEHLGPDWRALKAELERRGLPTDEIDASGRVRVIPRNIGDELADRIKSDFASAEREYSALKDTEGGQVLNTDIARELSPEYRADRTRSADVHEAASQFVKDLYAKKLAAPTPEGKLPTVLFTGGGTGAGKSTGLSLLGGLAKQAEIIYDTNMNTLSSAVSKIEQALNAGRKVSIVYTYRDPIEALQMGALPRAMRMGRTVPLKSHAETHIGARKVIDELAAKYAGDDRVQIMAIDNSRGKGNAAVVPVAEIPTFDHNGLEEKLHVTAKQEFDAGRISADVYRGTTGADPARPMVSASGEATRGKPEQAGGEPGRSQAGAESLIDFTASGEPPILKVAGDALDVAPILAERGDMVIAAENGAKELAVDALAKADAEIASSVETSQGFDAAVSCVLRG